MEDRVDFLGVMVPVFSAEVIGAPLVLLLISLDSTAAIVRIPPPTDKSWIVYEML